MDLENSSPRCRAAIAGVNAKFYLYHSNEIVFKSIFERATDAKNCGPVFAWLCYVSSTVERDCTCVWTYTFNAFKYPKTRYGWFVCRMYLLILAFNTSICGYRLSYFTFHFLNFQTFHVGVLDYLVFPLFILSNLFYHCCCIVIYFSKAKRITKYFFRRFFLK